MAKDILAAIVFMLRTDVDVEALVSQRVYGEEMPDSEVSNQPRPAVVVRRAGGGSEPGGFLDLQAPALEVYCFGETPARAEVVRLAVHTALKFSKRKVVQDTLLHSFDQIGSPQAMRDPDTQWPYSLSSWRCLASEIQVTT